MDTKTKRISLSDVQEFTKVLREQLVADGLGKGGIPDQVVSVEWSDGEDHSVILLVSGADYQIIPANADPESCPDGIIRAGGGRGFFWDEGVMK